MATSIRLLAMLVAAAGCGGVELAAGPPAEPRSAAEPAPAAPNPPSASADDGATKPPAAEKQPAPEAAAAPGRVPDSSSVDLLVEGAGPVRGRIVYVDVTWVEVTVKGVDRLPTGEPPRIRYTLRLCSEDGATSGKTYRWSKEEGSVKLADDFVFETVSDGPIHRVFYTPGGTGWDLQGTATADERGNVRFRFDGVRLACTK